MPQAENKDEFRAFADRAGAGPVVMVNLLRFAPDGGADRYLEYSRAVGPLLKKAGASVRYMGRGAQCLIGADHDRWDMVALIEYPQRGALLDMISSPEYRAVRHLREEALTSSVLLATEPMNKADVTEPKP